MPLSSLRHAFSDGVADIDTVLVRTHLFGPGASAPESLPGSSIRPPGPTGARISGGSSSLRCDQPRPSTADVHRLKGPKRPPETLCILDCCCCGGSLLILWMVSSYSSHRSATFLGMEVIGRSINWLTKWMTEWMINWLIDWLTEWTNECMSDLTWLTWGSAREWSERLTGGRINRWVSVCVCVCLCVSVCVCVWIPLQ